jgi:DNA mismatch repair protein MutS
MDTLDIQRVLRGRYGGAAASDILVQFARVELARPDALAWMQNGKFYEVYGDPARLLGRLLDLRVAEKPLMTGRDGQPLMLAMTGITIGSERAHLARLLRMGYRVAIGREVEGEREGTVKARQLAEVITPGTVWDEDLLDDERRLLAVAELRHDAAALAAADVSTGLLWCETWVGPEAQSRLLDALGRLGPAELLCNAELGREERARLGEASGITRLEGERAQRHRALCDELRVVNSYHVGRLSPLPNWWFAAEACREALQTHFGTVDLRPFGLGDQPAALAAVGVLIRYLQWNRLPALGRLQTIRVGGERPTLELDATSRRTLDIVTGPDGGTYGSLLGVLDQARTPMGARLLKSWLLAGLRQAEPLEARYDAVEAGMRQPLAREAIRRCLGQMGDLERVVNRLLIGPERATPKDMARLRDALGAAALVVEPLTTLGGLGLAAYDSLPDLADLLQRALAPVPRSSLLPRSDAETGELLAPGWDAGLDALLQREQHAHSEIERLATTLSLTTGLRSLQIKRDARTRQLVLTVATAEARRVPADWGRVGKGKEHYTNAELVLLGETLAEAEAQRADVELAAWGHLWERVRHDGAALMHLAACLAQIDVLTTLAHVATQERWVRPEIAPNRSLSIVNGRHPVVCRTVDDYIPATVTLDEGSRLIVLTGPNMSGKSTLMRMVALCVVLAQMGSFVPADAMRWGLCDRIFTRIGASDDIASGRSTFLVEMCEVATIIHQASADSLVVLDEVGRGTATYDGMALAEAIVEHLHLATGCRGIFATHYHHLVQQLDHLPGIACLQMGVRRTSEGLIFLHTLQPGVAEGSFGIAVARMAGIPSAILDRARARLAALEAEAGQRLAPSEQAVLAELTQRLAQLDSGALSHSEAVAALAELQRVGGVLLTTNSQG